MSNHSNKVYYDAKGRMHRRGPFNSSERHHHHHRHHRSTSQKVLLVILYVLLALAAIILISWRVLDARGKSALYRRSSEEAPVLSEIETEEQTSAVQEAREKAEEWKSGWVRYNGSVYEYNSDILTFLVMGIDKKGKAKKAKNGISGGQADALFLLVMNPDLEELSIIAINRNTITDIDVYDKEGNFVGTGKAQICLQHGYGDGLEQSCERQEKAVRNLFYNLPIHGYAAVNMGAIATLTDAVGGVTVPKMTYENGKIVYGEKQTLNGEEAYNYVRLRGKDFDSASYRLEKQKEFLKAFAAKMKEQLKTNPAKAVDIYNSIMSYVVTDVDLSEITYLAGKAGGYQFNSDIRGLAGTTTPETEAQTQHEEFIYNDDALYDLMVQTFYKRVR